MSFHETCQNIHLIHENGATLLHCEVRRRNNEFVARTIRLDRHIGNTDGWFLWGGSNFTETARDIQLVPSERGPKLTAFLRTKDGSHRELQGLYLADKIANKDGELVFLGP
ncbi:Cyanovirin-N [Aspergillus ellipticus CBS 707.79]|uniref:Cyanovirin-N n=1 Tax=Aspergillus ellipticus CBS 707.79 TaxID=1448320 RepID=A0A319CWX5_9EURO|nr:Cyanovirin-N [Aspergillus ellipticus CBS 707.79]